MPEITVTQIAIAAGAVIGGAIVGWILRARRCVQEKAAVNEGWQAQIEAQRAEHERLVTQNKGLMQQVSQFQASHKDATNRAKELSDALKEAFQRRDELQREIKNIRNKLQSAMAEREKLQSDIRERVADGDSAAAAIRQKDDKILRLSRELENWQNRLPPLIDRFRERNREANALEEALEAARARVVELENLVGSDETRVEPVDRQALGDDIDASNDPNNITRTGLPDVFAQDDAADVPEAPPEIASAEAPALDEAADAGDTNDVTDATDTTDSSETTDTTDTAAVAGAPPEETSDNDAAPPGDAMPDDTISPTALVPEALLLSGYGGFASDAGDDDDEWTVDDDPDEWRADDDAIPAASADEPESTETGEAVGAALAAPGDGGLRPASDDVGLNHQEARGGLRDNLKLIKGVGPAIEKTLNELGIFRFNQIAEMSEYDIDRVARRLKGFRSRIYREDWIGQARDLQEQKSPSHH